MPISPQISAYEDCFDLYQQALEDSIGVRTRFDDYGGAHHFVTRMHQARVLQRRESTRLYKQSDPQWNKSEYDALVVSQPREDDEGKWWVYVKHRPLRGLVERLSEQEGTAE